MMWRILYQTFRDIDSAKCRLPPVVSHALSGAAPPSLQPRSQSLREKAARRTRRRSGTNAPASSSHPSRRAQTIIDAKRPPAKEKQSSSIERPPWRPAGAPMSRTIPRRARHSFPLSHQHIHTRSDSRSGGGGHRDAANQDVPRRRAHSAGLGAPAGVLPSAASTMTKALVAATVGSAKLAPELTGSVGAGVGHLRTLRPSVFARHSLLRPTRPVLTDMVTPSLARPWVMSTPVQRLRGLAHRSPMWSSKPLVLPPASSSGVDDKYVLSSLAVAEMNGRILDGDLLQPE